MRPRYVQITAGHSLSSCVLARGGRTLVGLRRGAGDAWTLQALDVASGAALWSSLLASWATLLVHEDAGVVVTCEQERMLCWDLDTGAARFREMDGFHARAALPNGRVLSLEDVPGIAPDGTRVDEGTRACILDIERGAIVGNFGLHAKVAHAAVDSAGTRLLTHVPKGPTGGHHVVLWDLEARAPLLGLDGQLANALLVFRPGASDQLVAPWHIGGPALFDVHLGAAPRVDVHTIRDPDPERAPLMSFALSPDGRFLATAHADERDNHWVVGNALCVWDLVDKRRVSDIAVAGEYWPSALAFGPRRLVGVSDSGSTRTIFEVAL